MEEEIWKDIPGYEGYYQASNLGRIKSLDRYVNGKNGCLILIKGIHLKFSITHHLYHRVTLSKDNKKKHFFVHRILGLTFLYKIEGKNYINHIDGNKFNNCINNLEWCTSSENQLHSQRVLKNTNHFKTNNPSKGKFGKDSFVSKGIIQYDINGKYINEFDSITEAGKILSIDIRLISPVCKGIRKQTNNFIFKYK